jgi:hypothetical protein
LGLGLFFCVLKSPDEDEDLAAANWAGGKAKQGKAKQK